MVGWKHIIDIGHTEFMFPLAAAIAAWLVAGKAWKLALCWCALFVVGTGLVALSKISFLGWGTEIPALGFKALSGHALCATAVLPVFLFVVLQSTAISWRIMGAACGIAASMSIGALMVYFGYHTAAEVIGSFLLGLIISLGYVRLSHLFPPPQAGPWSMAASMLAFVLVFSMKPSLINHRLVDMALHLSGRDRPFHWPKKLMCKDRIQANG